MRNQTHLRHKPQVLAAMLLATLCSRGLSKGPKTAQLKNLVEAQLKPAKNPHTIAGAVCPIGEAHAEH
jgi:hypothetical protein